MKNKTFEVVPFVSAGYFVHGDRLGEMFIERKKDAELIAKALQAVENLEKKANSFRDAELYLEELDI